MHNADTMNRRWYGANMAWDLSNLEQQTSRVVLITGANSGIGYEAALALAEKGARLILACRDTQKATAAREKILKTLPGTSVDTCPFGGPGT